MFNKLPHAFLRTILLVLGLGFGGEVSASPPVTEPNPAAHSGQSDTILIAGRKLLDEFSRGVRRTRVIPTVTIRVSDGSPPNEFDPGDAFTYGEEYYLQYVRAGVYGDVISSRVDGP